MLLHSEKLRCFASDVNAEAVTPLANQIHVGLFEAVRLNLGSLRLLLPPSIDHKHRQLEIDVDEFLVIQTSEIVSRIERLDCQRHRLLLHGPRYIDSKTSQFRMTKTSVFCRGLWHNLQLIEVEDFKG